MNYIRLITLITAAIGLAGCGSDSGGPVFGPGDGNSGEGSAEFTSVAEALDITRSTLATPDFIATVTNEVVEAVQSVNLNSNPGCASGNYRLIAPVSNTRTAIEFDNCDQFSDGINTIDGILNGSIDIAPPGAGRDGTTVDFRRFSFLNRAFFANGNDRRRDFEGDITYGTLIEVNGDRADIIMGNNLFYSIAEGTSETDRADAELEDLDQEVLIETIGGLVQLDAIGLVNGTDFDGLIDFETEVPVVDTGEIVQGRILLLGANNSFIRVVDAVETNKADVEIDFDGDGTVDTDPDLQWDWFGANGILGRR